MAEFKFPRNTTFQGMIDKMDLQNATLSVIAAALGGKQTMTSMTDFKQLVRSGNASKLYNVGDIIMVERATAVSISVADSTGVTAATVNMTTFLAGMGKSRAGVYELAFDGAVWKWVDGVAANLATYGITITGTPVEGDHLVITETTTPIAWVITGFDEEDGLPAGLTHSVTVHTLDLVIKQFPFNASEVLYYCETALPAGTYNITLDHGAYGGGTAQDGTYQFVTAQNIPAGGGIRHTTIGAYRSGGYSKAQITAGTFTTYSDLSTGTIIESGLAVTEGSSGTSLGTFTASNPTYGSTGNCNFAERNAYGSNDYATSDANLWLNSCAEPGEWWHKESKFGLPNSKKGLAGFLYGLDKEFVDALVPVRKQYQKSVAEGYGLGEVTAKMFLLSRTEVFGGVERPADGAEGAAYTYFQRFSDLSVAGAGNDANRIKYATDGTIYYWWLRGAYPGIANYVRRVDLAGQIRGGSACNDFGLAPACVIA